MELLFTLLADAFRNIFQNLLSLDVFKEKELTIVTEYHVSNHV